MKNQYVGDINDYRKYGLIRSIQAASHLETLVAWMLTPDDGSNDGNILAYLGQSAKWSHFDPELFRALNNILSSDVNRSVDLIENSGILGNAKYFSEVVPDASVCRGHWINSLLLVSKGADLVFLDPDNGLEVKSKSIGTKNSSKFLYYQEVASMWQEGKSLLIYQHFPRVQRSKYIAQRSEELLTYAAGAAIEVFFTPHVAFFLLLQTKHARSTDEIKKEVLKRWPHQFGLWDRVHESPVVEKRIK